MERFGRFFQEKIILGTVMCILLGVVLTTATTAWYAINNSARTYGIELKAGGTGGIKVAAVAGGVDIMLDESLSLNEEGIPCLSIALKDFENIESGKIAPGAYIPMDFYIRTSNPTPLRCRWSTNLQMKTLPRNRKAE